MANTVDKASTATETIAYQIAMLGGADSTFTANLASRAALFWTKLTKINSASKMLKRNAVNSPGSILRLSANHPWATRDANRTNDQTLTTKIPDIAHAIATV